MDQIGYVYKYTHNTTGKWYIGSHDGSDPNYSGSGTVWCKAKTKYGLESFTKEILYTGGYFREYEEMMLKLLDASSDSHSYNLKNEAIGGSFPGELNGMYGRKLTPEERYVCGNAFRGIKRPDHSHRMTGEGNPMFGKNDHTHGIVNRMKSFAGMSYVEIFGEDRAAEIRANLSAAQKGKKHNLKRVTCPHCPKSGSGPNMTRYHFDKCKQNKSL
ncbi:hypothetical protein [Yersinia phage MHG19]|nr:hypothetical protein [Yersinia phage MHG19]